MTNRTHDYILLLTIAFLMLVSPIQLLRADELPETFKIIPQPRQIALNQADPLPFGTLKTILINGNTTRPVTGPILSELEITQSPSSDTLTLELKPDETPESDEGYILIISKDATTIQSRTDAGLFYGCQTLEQLLEDARDTAKPIPACTITDYPALNYRAIHIDVKHHLDKLDYYYQSIDRLAKYKINAIIFEFEDKLGYKRRPTVAGPLNISIDDMKKLTDYARQRHIEISPLVQGLGHATYILKHKEFAHLREDPKSNWAFCPLKDETYDILFDLYLDAIEATPGSRYLHIGGDEIGNMGQCELCKPIATMETGLSLNLFWLNRVCDFAKEHNRIPIVWDDMPLNYAGLYATTYRNDITEKQLENAWKNGGQLLESMINRFPKNCLYMRWNYTLARQPGNIRVLDWYKQKGLNAIIATAAQNTTALLPQNDRVNIIQSFISLAAERGINGMLCTAWDDSSPHMETYWRGLIASAEYSWSPDKRTLEQYETAYLQREFGPECTDATDLYAELYQGVVFWRRALLAKGERVYKPEEIMDVPDLTTPGQWSNTHKDRLTIAQRELTRHDAIANTISELAKKAKRNQYQLEMLKSINDLQITSASLLVALSKCDTDNLDQKAQGFLATVQSLKQFDAAWKQLQTTYAKTRYLAYPDSFIKDRYFHFASKTEDLTWLILIEKDYHKLVVDWLRKNNVMVPDNISAAAIK